MWIDLYLFPLLLQVRYELACECLAVRLCWLRPMFATFIGQRILWIDLSISSLCYNKYVMNYACECLLK